MANLHAGTVRTTNQFSFVNATAANSGARKDTYDTPFVFSGTKFVLTVNASINVVGNLDGESELFLDRRTNRHVLPAEVRRFLNFAFCQVQWTGAADS